MRVVLLGADFEENLGVGMIAAAAEAGGHSVRVVPFNSPGDRGRVLRHVAAAGADVVRIVLAAARGEEQPDAQRRGQARRRLEQSTLHSHGGGMASAQQRMPNPTLVVFSQDVPKRSHDK
jgi:hypothetical protein